MPFLFEKLDVYQKSLELVDEISKLVNEKKLNPALRDQLNRASLSISLNIAEGTGRFSKAEKRNFYLIARGSTYECVAIMQVLLRQKTLAIEEYDLFYRKYEAISKMLSGLIKGVEGKTASIADSSRQSNHPAATN